MERLGGGTEKTGLWRIALPDKEQSQHLLKRTGVVLTRKNTPDGDSSALLFLKERGAVWVSVPGASRGSQRFGGALEPLVWGHFQLYQSRRRMYVREIEVQDDFWGLRRLPRAMAQALRWAKLLQSRLIEGYPQDDILTLFYWALKAVLDGTDPEIVHCRFLWRWLQSWGVAPSFDVCSECGAPLNGSGTWADGSFMCRRCSQTEDVIEFDEFAHYAASNRFVPEKITPRLLKQARSIADLLLKNLDENK